MKAVHSSVRILGLPPMALGTRAFRPHAGETPALPGLDAQNAQAA